MIYPRFTQRYLAVILICFILGFGALGAFFLIYLYNEGHYPLVLGTVTQLRKNSLQAGVQARLHETYHDDIKTDTTDNTVYTPSNSPKRSEDEGFIVTEVTQEMGRAVQKPASNPSTKLPQKSHLGLKTMGEIFNSHDDDDDDDDISISATSAEIWSKRRPVQEGLRRRSDNQNSGDDDTIYIDEVQGNSNSKNNEYRDNNVIAETNAISELKYFRVDDGAKVETALVRLQPGDVEELRLPQSVIDIKPSTAALSGIESDVKVASRRSGKDRKKKKVRKQHQLAISIKRNRKANEENQATTIGTMPNLDTLYDNNNIYDNIDADTEEEDDDDAQLYAASGSGDYSSSFGNIGARQRHREDLAEVGVVEQLVQMDSDTQNFIKRISLSLLQTISNNKKFKNKKKQTNTQTQSSRPKRKKGNAEERLVHGYKLPSLTRDRDEKGIPITIASTQSTNLDQIMTGSLEQKRFDERDGGQPLRPTGPTHIERGEKDAVAVNIAFVNMQPPAGMERSSSGISGAQPSSAAWLETRTRRIIGNVKKSEERSRQLLLCEEAGGGELCRMLFKGHLTD